LGWLSVATRASQLFLWLDPDRLVYRPEITIDLTNRRMFELEGTRTCRPFGFEIFSHRHEDPVAQLSKVIAHDRFPGCNLDYSAGANPQHAAPNGNVMLDVVLVAPSCDANSKYGQEIRVSRGNAESAAGILGTDIAYRFLVNRDLSGRGNNQSH
jgi:hypothetical protein